MAAWRSLSATPALPSPLASSPARPSCLIFPAWLADSSSAGRIRALEKESWISSEIQIGLQKRKSATCRIQAGLIFKQVSLISINKVIDEAGQIIRKKKRGFGLTRSRGELKLDPATGVGWPAGVCRRSWRRKRAVLGRWATH